MDIEFTGRTRKDVATLAFNLIALLYATGVVSDEDLKDLAAETPGLTVR